MNISIIPFYSKKDKRDIPSYSINNIYIKQQVCIVATDFFFKAKANDCIRKEEKNNKSNVSFIEFVHLFTFIMILLFVFFIHSFIQARTHTKKRGEI